MTCRLCGARIGILERWRYGDFCSREHKEEFAFENERLAEEILRDLRRPGSASEPVAIPRLITPEPAEAVAAAEVEEPEPEAAGHIAQQGASPVRPAKAAVKDEAPRTKPGWKEFASLANLDRVPVSAAKSKMPSSRLLWVEEPPREEGSYVHVQKRSLGLPHTHYRRRRPALRIYDQLLSIDPPEQTQTPAVTVDPSLWEGWPADRENGWDAEPENAVGPDLGDVLEGYPITAPWDRWERWPVAAPAALPPSGRGAPAGRAVPAPAAGATSTRTPPAPAYPGAVPGGPLMPHSGAAGGRTAPPARAASGGRGRTQAPAPSGPGGIVMPGGPGGIVMPGGPGVTLPAIPGMGGGGRAGAPVRGGGGYDYGLPFAGAWREMAPPMFLAQSDPAAGLDPLNRPHRTFTPANAYAHTRPRIFRPRPRLLPPQPRVPEPSLCLPVRVRLADGWTPKPAEPVRWRP
jgi:hypothetical protein